MPTYEYACLSCGEHVEVYQRFSDEPLSGCGVCGGQLRKVFHPAGILFKGSGFYATDSRSSRAGVSSRDGHGESGEKGGGKTAERVEAASKGEPKGDHGEGSSRSAKDG